METSKNDITGDSILSRNPSDAYSVGWDRIFGKQLAEDVLEKDKQQNIDAKEKHVNTRSN